jgi:arginase
LQAGAAELLRLRDLLAQRKEGQSADAGAFRAALSGLGGLPVYLHVDVDILDSTEVPGLRFPSGPGPALGDVENCLNAITASADVVAASLACAWLPGQVGRPPARAAITRLASALGQAMRPA